MMSASSRRVICCLTGRKNAPRCVTPGPRISRNGLDPRAAPHRASRRTTGTRSHSRSPSVNAVDLGRHDEVVLMQSLDLLGLQRHRRIAPTEADIRMMAFGFRELADLLNKGQRLPEIAKPEAPLDAMSFVHQLPVRRLWLKELGLVASERRYSPATGSAGLADKSFGHVACSSNQPSRAPRPANCQSDIVSLTAPSYWTDP